MKYDKREMKKQSLACGRVAHSPGTEAVHRGLRSQG